MKPEAVFETDIDGLAHDGRGVARIDGKTTFVDGALPGERVRLRLRRRHRQYDEAELLEVLNASAERVAPRCAHFGVCGGCSLQHQDPAAQLRAKQGVLAENFERIGKVSPKRWLAPLRDEPWGYRRRGRLSVRHVAKKGRTLVGFREAANPRYVADIRHCDVIDPRLGPVLGEIGDLVSSLAAAAEIAQIEFAAADAMVALVFRHLKPLSADDLTALRGFGERHGFAIYLQPGGNDSVHPLWPEQPELRFHLPDDGIEFAFEPLDFVQVNARINQRMVAQVMELLAPEPQHRVLDLFCGLGNFTLPLARRVAEVAGVEGDAALVRRAGANAARNGIDNAEFHLADLFQNQRDLAWARRDWDAILLDPPRAGAEQVLDYLPRKATRRVVYVSCHPASLARDAGMLVHRHGFRLAAAGVMDMFPHTAHVESVALFERD
ncbi:MAG TPA: 23S rRNA (uracil(1939)-C(5))-methyltransferase RlmD [Rhodanobacteraceae bacterium]|nr:23S rRNA (uracil(1939)-C(5))-methyltransferase RlmD [Rhodanobacteraceae bacterium]